MDILCAIRGIKLQHYSAYKKICWSFNLTENRPMASKAIELAHRIHGNSPTPSSIPILVLHGFLGSKRNWETLCKTLTATTNTTVVGVDARNHGDSPHNASHTYVELAADVSKLITKFAVKKAIIIGHSMGGRTGMVLALTEPSKVASLVVVDISPVSTTSSLTDFFPKVLTVMRSVNFQGLDSVYKAKEAAKAKIAESGLFQSNDEMHFILMNIGKLSDGTFGWKCNVAALDQNFHNVASFPNMDKNVYRGPTLFIGGKLSYFIPPDDLSGIRRLFPKAELEYVEGAGHNVHAENPKAFLRLVTQFLSTTASFIQEYVMNCLNSKIVKERRVPDKASNCHYSLTWQDENFNKGVFDNRSINFILQ